MQDTERMIRPAVLFPLFALLLSCAGDTGLADRPSRWAEPLDRPGLTNLYRVTEALYRGAQPGPEGFAELHRMGIRTVVNLRSFHSDRDDFEKAGLAPGAFRYVHIRMKTWHAEDEDVARFLRVVTDPANAPVFVHCEHGSDRTGVAVAAYRIVVQRWPKEEAIREMTEGGTGFHGAWDNLVGYLRDLDVPRIRRRVRAR